MTTVKHREIKEVYQSGYLRFIREEIVLPTGEKIERDILKHPGAVVIIPIKSNGKLIMIEQYRFPVRKPLIEFPAGTIENTENPEAAALREMREETSYSANRLVNIGTLCPTPGFCDEIQHIFVALELKQSSLPKDQDELIETVEFEPTEIEDKIRNGQITDAKTIAAYTQVKLAKLLPS